MMTSQDDNQNTQGIAEQVNALLSKVASTQIASLDENSQAQASYTPYLWHQHKVYIFVSELASHTRNLRQRPNASLMMIEDEADAKNIFARQRLILESEAAFIPRDHADWTELLAAFEARHGSTVTLLKKLSDFHLICLTPRRGSYVKGFGQAYAFEGVNFDQARQLSN